MHGLFLCIFVADCLFASLDCLWGGAGGEGKGVACDVSGRVRVWVGRGGAGGVERGRMWRVWRAEACGAGHPELSLLTRLGLLNPDDDSAIFGARCQHLPRALKSPTIEYVCRSEKSYCRKLTVQISPHLPELRMRPINLSIKESRCAYEPNKGTHI